MPTLRRSPRSVKSVEAVMSALQKLNHATVQDVLEWISVSQPQTDISLTTTYRALNSLVQEGRVKPLNFNDGQVRYELNHHGMHHHHVVCTGCNTVEIIDICPYEMIASKVKPGFQVQYHNFEVFGLCATCQN